VDEVDKMTDIDDEDISASDGGTHPSRSPPPEVGVDNEDMPRPEDLGSSDFETGSIDENGVMNVGREMASGDCDVPDFEDFRVKSVQEDLIDDKATVSAVINNNNLLTWNE